MVMLQFFTGLWDTTGQWDNGHFLPPSVGKRVQRNFVNTFTPRTDIDPCV